MKAVILNKNFQLEDGFAEKPQPKNNEVLIKIKASGFNPVDYQMLENKLERKLISSPILGRELSGIVIEKGTSVTQFNIGDEVFCGSSMGSNGSYTEYIAIPESVVSHKPKNISFEQATAIPSVGVTALQVFNRLQPNKNDTILITGATGGVGSFLIKLLLAHNIQKIIATVGNEENKNILLKMGLQSHQIINYKNDNLIENILKANQNNLFDFGIDLVGNYMSEITAETLKTNGTYVDVTALTTQEARDTLFHKGSIIMNISNYAYIVDKNHEYYKNSFKEISRLLENNSINPPNYKIVGELSLETVLKAHSMLKNNETKGNKLIMIH
ncbi:NADP-dependent oxidoreductase [Chryseobacterium oryctis]|uniref:NADP-dependent oxidoreductase n=1 Tax=Chryseobacterium oryctis TaxID=2952618 RepID=A0ABT3HNX8_9FLAO|nr:NADP-dependent oxidoreductase [Chryseobacterium oryctis]MCW3161453.1 NADP-dependent oxidoreductase [Chryseobacterium oryctis]